MNPSLAESRRNLETAPASMKVLSRKFLAGFTLVETLVAIAIITVAIVGPYHAVQTSLRVSYSARDALTASSLAQEAIEYVRSQRDNNYIYNTANPSTAGTWLYGIDGTTRAGVASQNCLTASCVVDISTPSVTRCASTCTPLTIGPDGMYTQHAADSTHVSSRFTRSITYTVINAHEVQLVSTVTWTTLGVPYTITVRDNLQDWL